MKLQLYFLAVLSFAAVATAGPYSLEQVISKTGDVRTETIRLPHLEPGRNYTLLFSLSSPASLTIDSHLEVSLGDGTRVLASKSLHAGDPDFYAPFHLSQAAAPELRLSAAGLTGRYTLQINRWPDSH